VNVAMYKEETDTLVAKTNPNVRVNSPPGMLMMDTDAIDAIPWCTLPNFPGLAIKYVWVDLEKGVCVSLIKIDKGIQLPVHVHYGTSMLFLLKGRFTYEPAGTIGPGGFGFEPFNTIHEPDSTTEEETLMWAINTHNEFLQLFNEDGSPGPFQHLAGQLKWMRATHGEASVKHLNVHPSFWES
jgi:anti-sigma factor ChrR (cupin superfamily)